MKYLIKAVFTPNNVCLDRRRSALMIEADTVLDAIEKASEETEAGHCMITSFHNSIASLWDLSHNYRWGYTDDAFDGTWDFAYELIKTDHQPVTRDMILELVNLESQKKGDHPNTILCNVLGRNIWNMIHDQDHHDLVDQLHDIRYNGFNGKAYTQMNMDELLDAAMKEIVDVAFEQFDDCDTPFSFEAMITSNTGVWFNTMPQNS